jgi:hypothetical protein
MRLSAITAPLTIEREINRYAKNWLALSLPFIKVVEYSVVRKQNTAAARIMKLLKLSSLNEKSMPNPAHGTEYIKFFLNKIEAITRFTTVINKAKYPIIFLMDFGIAKINKPAITGSNINMYIMLIIFTILTSAVPPKLID